MQAYKTRQFLFNSLELHCRPHKLEQQPIVLTVGAYRHRARLPNSGFLFELYASQPNAGRDVDALDFGIAPEYK